MNTTVFLVVIAAAVLHAIWNALVKNGSDKYLGMLAVLLGHIPIAVCVLPFVPLPSPESLPYLVFGIVLHIGYQMFLLLSYRAGDLSHVYPIARGTAPLLVTVISVLFLGVYLQPIELLAVAIIGAAIISLVLVRQSDGMRNAKAAGLALVTGGFIAAYSLVDGTGARIAGTALGFYAWLAIGNGFIFAVVIALSPQRKVFRRLWADGRYVLVFGGCASFAAYALVMWAFTQAPIALVTALRETSIVFAMLIGVFFLKERLNVIKVFSTMLTLVGAALLRFSK